MLTVLQVSDTELDNNFKKGVCLNVKTLKRRLEQFDKTIKHPRIIGFILHLICIFDIYYFMSFP